LHSLEQYGVLTFRSHASGFHVSLPHVGQVITRPLRSANAFRVFGLGLLTAHVRLQNVSLISFCFSIGKIKEQFGQTFQNGYTRFAFQCFGKGECVASASFNKAAMVSGDDLVCVISANTEGGIVVVIFDKLLNRLPLVLITIRNIAQCVPLANGFMVRFPPPVYQ